MVRRSTPIRKDDDRAFPVRGRVANPISDPLGIRLGEAQAWLVEHVGRGHFAVHGQAAFGLHAMGFYFRTVEAAARFREAFPNLALVDTTDSLQHLQRQRKAEQCGPSMTDCRQSSIVD